MTAANGHGSRRDRGVVTYVALLAGWIVLVACLWECVPYTVKQHLGSALAWMSAQVAGACGLEVSQRSTLLVTPTVKVRVAPDCLGMMELLVGAGGIVLSRASATLKAEGLVWLCIAVLGGNVARHVVLIASAQTAAASFTTVHNYVAPLCVLGVAIAFVWWFVVVMRRECTLGLAGRL